MEKDDGIILLKAVRNTISRRLGNDAIEIDLSKYNQNLGCFVTIKKKGELRGCIGFIEGLGPLSETIPIVAVQAAFCDPRFWPVKEDELKDLKFEISILSKLQKIDNPMDINLGIDGLLLIQGVHHSVFLPQVALETGWSKEEFLQSLSTKAGLGKDSYLQKDTIFKTFQCEVFSENAV